MPEVITRNQTQFGFFGVALALVTWFSGAAICLIIGACVGPVLAEDRGPIGALVRGRESDLLIEGAPPSLPPPDRGLRLRDAFSPTPEDVTPRSIEVRSNRALLSARQSERFVMNEIKHLSVDERAALGKAARERTRPSGHSGWAPAADRPDPVALLEEQNATREADLVPVRHGRMMVSPFTFYRGAAKIMAADLKDTPTAGLNVQLCGDAHLSNFGVFASPERALVFDLNDFDETLPGPFEYDVKRMAASFTIAARNNGFTDTQARDATLAAAAAYREAMAGFAEMRTMDIWYAHLSEADLMAALAAMTSSAKGADKKAAKTAEKNARKQRAEGTHP